MLKALPPLVRISEVKGLTIINTHISEAEGLATINTNSHLQGHPKKLIYIICMNICMFKVHKFYLFCFVPTPYMAWQTGMTS